MHKVLILLLTSILTACATDISVYRQGKIFTGMSASDLRDAHLLTKINEDPFLSGCNLKKYPSIGAELRSAASGNFVYLITGANPYADCYTQQGRLAHVYVSWPTYEEVLKRLNKSSENQNYTSKNPDKVPNKSSKKTSLYNKNDTDLYRQGKFFAGMSSSDLRDAHIYIKDHQDPFMSKCKLKKYPSIEAELRSGELGNFVYLITGADTNAKCDTQQGKLVHIYKNWPTYEEVLKRLNKSTENKTSSKIDDPFANKNKPKQPGKLDPFR